jgi:hypothetical protein
MNHMIMFKLSCVLLLINNYHDDIHTTIINTGSNSGDGVYYDYDE